MIYCCGSEQGLCSVCVWYTLGWRRGLHWGILPKHEMVIALGVVCVRQSAQAANWNFSVSASIESSGRLAVVAPHSRGEQPLPRIAIRLAPSLPPSLTPPPSNSFFLRSNSKWRCVGVKVWLPALASLLRCVLSNHGDWSRPVRSPLWLRHMHETLICHALVCLLPKRRPGYRPGPLLIHPAVLKGREDRHKMAAATTAVSSWICEDGCALMKEGIEKFQRKCASGTNELLRLFIGGHRERKCLY